jgi:hypothetical protein
MIRSTYGQAVFGGTVMACGIALFCAVIDVISTLW